MGERWFKPYSIAAEHGRRNVSRIHCSRCEDHNDIQPGGLGGLLPTDILVKQWKRRGWVVGSSPSHDLCPNCAVKTKAPKTGQVIVFKTNPESIFKQDNAVQPAAPAAETVHELTAQLKKQIIQRIEDYWLDPGGGYKDDMTDAEIGRKFGVPRGWVEDIREDVFGPLRDNEDIRTLRTKIKDKEKQAQEFEATIEKMIDLHGVFLGQIKDLKTEAERIYEKVC